MTGPKQQAFTSGAEGKKEVAPMPFMQDKCFLCSQQIAENAPRQFYTGPPGSQGVMMLAHTPCLNTFRANGEVWPGAEPKAPQESAEPAAKDVNLGSGFRKISYGHGKVAYDDQRLVLLCTDAIAEHGLKAVLPDLIVTLTQLQSILP